MIYLCYMNYESFWIYMNYLLVNTCYSSPEADRYNVGPPSDVNVGL